MKNTALITKDNRLIEASYRLSLVEHRIMQLAIAWTRHHKVNLTADTWVELQAAEYSSIYELDEKVSYRQLKTAARDLRDRRLSVEGIHPETGEAVTIEGGWVSYIMYAPKKGTISLQFSKLIIPYISALEERFTTYQIRHVSSFSSVYAIRLYELCKQYLTVGKRTFELAELRDYLEANEPSYDRNDNFKSKILDKAVEQINTSSDIHVAYTSEKTGRAVSGYTFKISKNINTSLLVDQPNSQQVANYHTLAKHWTTGERSMLQALQQIDPSLTAEAVIQQAQVQKTDVFMVLSELKHQLSLK